MSTAAMNEPRVRVVMGGKRVFYASLTAAQVLKNEHVRNREIHPGPSANKNAKPLQMTKLAVAVMQNEISRQNRHRRHVAPGERFNRLVVLSMALEAGMPLRWNCRCDCGVEKAIVGKHLMHGGTQSCGCLRNSSALKRWAKARKAAA